jgi:hypothetical protein
MSGDLVFRFLLGHLIGDYLLQTNWMALKKKSQTIPCLVHCSVWTACVCACLLPELIQLSIPRIFLVTVLIFLSHFWLDRFDLIEWWFRKIGSRSWREMTRIYDYGKPSLEKQAMTAYTALVQTVADNTLHLAFVYLIIRFLVP